MQKLWVSLLALFMATPLVAQEMAVSLRAQLEAFAGQPVALDPRVGAPPCADGVRIDWRDASGRALLARCPATGWQLVVPVGSLARSAPDRRPALLVRRGEPVVVRVGGAGFQVQVEGEALAEGRAGDRILVRNRRTGQRFAVEIAEDGVLQLARAAGG